MALISLKARSLSVFVFSVVLLAALLHAVWNSLLKGSSDKHMTMLAIALGHVPVALMMLPLAPSVDLAALPWSTVDAHLHLPDFGRTGAAARYAAMERVVGEESSHLLPCVVQLHGDRPRRCGTWW